MTEELLRYNKIKREQVRKMEIHKMIVKMRKELPIYNLEEIRENKMPYYDALVTNLAEKGFASTASFIEQLVEFQTKAREEAGPGSNIWMRPQLRYSHKELKYLSGELQKAEEFNFNGNHTRECDTFLRVAIHFAFSHHDWWWLGEQLLVQAINVSSDYPTLQGKFEALSRFAYAKFLISNLREYDNAKEQLLIARDLSKSIALNIESYIPNEKGTLYMKINYYTYECLIREARNMMSVDYHKAIEIAIQAKKRAAEACHTEGETQALLLKGLCEMNIDQAKNAILNFNKALKLQEGKENKEGLCKVMIQLAKAYLMDNNTSQSLRILNSLKDTAAKHHLHFYLAQAYKNMGEHYFNNKEYAIARRLLNKSLNLFAKENNASSDVALVQILEAIAWGLELFPKYVDLVFRAGNTAGSSGFENLNKLIDWKDSRKSFWDEALDADHSSFIDMMAADHQTITASTMVIEKYKEDRKLSKEAKKVTERENEKKNQSEQNDEMTKTVFNPTEANVYGLIMHKIIKTAVEKDLNGIVNQEQDENSCKNETKIVDLAETADEKQTNIIELHDNKGTFSISVDSVSIKEDSRPFL